MKEIKISKMENGYIEFYKFGICLENGLRCASHWFVNQKGTYFRNLDTRFFHSAEEGNEFYKKMRDNGFAVVK